MEGAAEGGGGREGSRLGLGMLWGGEGEKKGRVIEKREKKEYLKSQWKWNRGWPFPPLAAPEMLNLICLRCEFPSSPAAHGANVVTVRQLTVKTAPSHSA